MTPEILDIVEWNGKLVVVFSNDETIPDFEVDQFTFWDWVSSDIDRIETLRVVPDHRGEPVEEVHILDFEEYFSNPDFLWKDMKEYLKTHYQSGKLRQMPDLGGSFRKLLKQIKPGA